jgi:hypothetical protein
MTRREALQKATVTTPDVTYGLLTAEQSTSFLRKIKDQAVLTSRMRQEIRGSSTGEIDKLSTAARIIRAATENCLGKSPRTSSMRTLRERRWKPLSLMR